MSIYTGEYPLASKNEDGWYSDGDYESRGGHIEWMTPAEYLRKVRILEVDEVARENIDDLKQHILNGHRLDPLKIYADCKEDGRHRANAALELGIKTVPVIVFEKSMQNSADPHEWNMHAAQTLRDKAQMIEKAPSPCFLGKEYISFKHMEDEAPAAIARLTDSSAIDRDRCIYLIEIDAQSDAQAIQDTFRKAKRDLKLKLPKDNDNLSQCLYVGSSFATGKRKRTLRTRLRQHIIGANVSTFGLSLSKWTAGLKGGVSVSAWQYPAMNRSEEEMREIILAVEDWLSGQRKPMLGQRGIRN